MRLDLEKNITISVGQISVFTEWIYSKLSIQGTKKFFGTLQPLLLLFLCHLHHLQLQVTCVIISLCRCWEKKTHGWSFWSPTGCWGWGTPPPHNRHQPSSKNSARLWCTKRHKKALEDRPGMNEGFSSNVCLQDSQDGVLLTHIARLR